MLIAVISCIHKFNHEELEGNEEKYISRPQTHPALAGLT